METNDTKQTGENAPQAEGDSVETVVSRGKFKRFILVMSFAFRWNYKWSMIFRTPCKFWDNRGDIFEAFCVVLAFLALPIFWLCDVIHLITQPLWYPFTCKHTDKEIAIARKRLSDSD